MFFNDNGEIICSDGSVISHEKIKFMKGIHKKVYRGRMKELKKTYD